MRVSGAKSRLAAISKELSLRWAETRGYWKDAKAYEFDQRYMTELFAQVEKTVTVIEKLDDLLDRVRTDCE